MHGLRHPVPDPVLILFGLHISGTVIVVGNNYRYTVRTCRFFGLLDNIRGQRALKAQMDFIGVKTVPELLNLLGIPKQDLLLPCLICSKFLDPEDLQNFEGCKFSLVWRVEGVHGICRNCARVTAILERTNFHQGTFTANDFFDKHGEHVHCVHVRCYICLSKLSVPEIDCMVEAGQLFHLVRGIVRGFCEKCNQ